MSSTSAPEFGMATVTGPRRNVNEDVVLAPEAVEAGLPQKKGWLFVIADGVSGYVGAQEASVTAATTVMEEFYQDESPVAGAALEHAIQAANARLHERGLAVPDSGLRTTVGAVVLFENELTAANVGDSRVYLLQNRKLRQVSADHRWVTEQVQRGLITESDAVGHPFSHILTRSLGEKDQVQVDVHRETVRKGDSILLCTDGLYNSVPGGAIERILNEPISAADAAQQLVDLAAKGDAGDDISAIVIRPPAAPTMVPKVTAVLSKPSLTLPQTLGLVAGAVVLVLLARVAWGWLTTPPTATPQPTATVRAPLPTVPPTAATTVPPTARPATATPAPTGPTAVPGATATRPAAPTATARPGAPSFPAAAVVSVLRWGVNTTYVYDQLPTARPAVLPGIELPEGTKVQVTDLKAGWNAFPEEADGNMWYKITWGDGKTGWTHFSSLVVGR